MNLKNIDHIGIAVTSIQESLSFWETSLGIELHGIEEMAEQKLRDGVPARWRHGDRAAGAHQR